MIAAFVVDKMAAYVAGGIKPETAAHFTRGAFRIEKTVSLMAGDL
jgi:hypothetical protein